MAVAVQSLNPNVPLPPAPSQLSGVDGRFPDHFSDLKRRLIPKEREQAVVKAWGEILTELSKATAEFKATGPDVSQKLLASCLYVYARL